MPAFPVPGPALGLTSSSKLQDQKHYPIFHMRRLSSERLGVLLKTTQQGMNLVCLIPNQFGWGNSCPIGRLGNGAINSGLDYLPLTATPQTSQWPVLPNGPVQARGSFGPRPQGLPLSH